MSPAAIGSSEGAMTLDDIVSLLVCIGLLVYLTIALLKPERF